MTKYEMDKWTEALRGQALTWEQTMFAVSLILEAIHTEREACAKVCESLRDLQMYADKQEAQNDCAAAIRAKGDKK
jgi:hypothetical protein